MRHVELNKHPYPYIRAWGRMLHSFEYYISDQIERAQADNAPVNAIYRDNDGRWHTVDDIDNAETKDFILKSVAYDR